MHDDSILCPCAATITTLNPRHSYRTMLCHRITIRHDAGAYLHRETHYRRSSSQFNASAMLTNATPLQVSAIQCLCVPSLYSASAILCSSVASHRRALPLQDCTIHCRCFGSLFTGTLFISAATFISSSKKPLFFFPVRGFSRIRGFLSVSFAGLTCSILSI